MTNRLYLGQNPNWVSDDFFIEKQLSVILQNAILRSHDYFIKSTYVGGK